MRRGSTFTDVLRNPTNNIAAFALIIAALTVVMLVVVLLLLLAFMSGDDDDEDEYEDEEGAPVAVAAPVITAADLPDIPLTPEEIKARRIRRYISALIWLLIFSGVWIVGGVVTRQDVLCESCHVKTIHVARVDKTQGRRPAPAGALRRLPRDARTSSHPSRRRCPVARFTSSAACSPGSRR